MPDSLLSAEIKRDVSRQRFGTTIVQDDIKPTAQSLSRSIPKILIGYDTDNLTKKERSKLLKEVADKVGLDWSAMWSEINPQLMEVAMIEGKQVAELYNEFAPEDFIAPAAKAIEVAATTSTLLLTGAKVSEGVWAKFMADNVTDATKAINTQIVKGIKENQSLNQIVQRLRGKYNRHTKKYVGGVINGTVNSRAEALARTGLSHYSSMARDEFANANSDVIVSRITLITLDNKTTTICLGRNGKEYKLGDDYPKLPYHFNERTIYVFKTPGFDPSKTERVSVGGQKGKAAEEAYDKRKHRQDALRDGRAEKRADGQATPETKSKVTNRGRKDEDIFHAKLVKGDMGSDEWMRGQPSWFQNSSLGKERADLFRNGMSIDRFNDMTGRKLTLAELRAGL